MQLDLILSSSDCRYSLTPANGNATHIFLKHSFSEEIVGLFGANSKQGDHYVLVLNHANIADNLINHYIRHTPFFDKESSNSAWFITLDYLLEKLGELDEIFAAEEDFFDVSINRQLTGQKRTFLTGINNTASLTTHKSLRFKDYFFGGDRIRIEKGDTGKLRLSLLAPQDCRGEISCSENLLGGLLRGGDRFSGKDDGEFAVAEVLPRVYRIKVEKTGKIRSVPKTVVAAWYKFYQTHATLDYDIKKNNGVIEHKKEVPIRDAATRAIREIVNETTIDDKYEHGYDGMLGTIARWLLDHPERSEMPMAESPEVPLPTVDATKVDRLATALKLFEEDRKGESKYDDGAARARQMFCDVDGEKLKSLDWNDFCSHHFNSSQASAYFRDYDDDLKVQLGNWLKDVRENPLDIARELERMPKLKGLGTGGTISCMFLMKANPVNFCSYAGQGHASLVFLGLEVECALPSFSLESYYHNKELQTRVLKEMSRLGIGREDGQTADYITVNEFLWWVSVNEDLIKEKVMASVYKPTEIKKVEQTKIDDFAGFIKQLEEDVKSAGLKYAKDLMKRFVCAQLAKPFVVLTGLSGSGKTKLAEAFAKWIGVENTYRIVPVGADWTNNEKLLGYPNALDPDKYVLPDTGVLKLMIDAERNHDLPFFLILDEMNLSHVERYFADFLSVMESDGTIKLYDGTSRSADDGTPVPQRIKFPKNLFVIGTMNVDETTYMFSPKVLDRAQVIEFRVSADEIGAFLEAPAKPDMEALSGKGAQYAKAFLELAKERTSKSVDSTALPLVKTTLVDLFKPLADLGSEFGYRSAIEIVTFIAYYLEACGYKKLVGTPQKDCLRDAIDAAVLQKLLPKLHGSLNHLMPVLEAMVKKVSKTETPVNDPDATPEEKPIYHQTYEKLKRMQTRLDKNGFTSFAEA